MKTPEPKKDRKTTTAIFANSKGGVGKSTLALLTCLGLASRFKSASVELIDLDSQSTSSDSLQKFANDRFSVINDDQLFLASGSPNNGNIVNHIVQIHMINYSPSIISSILLVFFPLCWLTSIIQSQIVVLRIVKKLDKLLLVIYLVKQFVE